MEKEKYHDLFLYLKDKKYDPSKSEKDRRSIRRKVKNFSHDEHHMYYTKDGLKKQVVTRERLKSVIKLCHEECGSHLGRDKT